jgi:hypothetical protein
MMLLLVCDLWVITAVFPIEIQVMKMYSSIVH